MKKLISALAFMVSIAPAFSQQAVKIDKRGMGRPILLLPGFTSPASVWDGTIQRLDGAWESHAVSYAGFNGLEPISFPWYDQLKNQLVEYVKKNDLSNLTIIGHSMGGNLAIDLTAELPTYVRGLILVESIPCMRELMMPGVPANSLQYDSPYNRQILEMSDEDFKQMASGISQNMTFNKSSADLITRWTLEADRKTYVYGYTDLLKLDLRDKLKAISINTMILGASFPDKSVVLSNYEKQFANLASKEVLIADTSKHFVMFDQPTWLANNINRYMKANGQR